MSEVVHEWWGGRAVRGLLPRLFFEHFRPSSFAFETNGAIEGFLVGFRSQSSPTVGYIHFVGVSPSSRGRGYGRMLYERFFEAVAAMGCDEVRCITSPLNTGSIAFHQRMGFEILPGNGKINDFRSCWTMPARASIECSFRKQLLRS